MIYSQKTKGEEDGPYYKPRVKGGRVRSYLSHVVFAVYLKSNFQCPVNIVI